MWISGSSEPAPLPSSIMETGKLLWTHKSDNLPWSINTTAAVKKKTQQSLYFLRRKTTFAVSCWWPSTGLQWGASYHTASQCDTWATQQLIKEHYNRSSTRHRRSSSALCPHSMTSLTLTSKKYCGGLFRPQSPPVWPPALWELRQAQKNSQHQTSEQFLSWSHPGP